MLICLLADLFPVWVDFRLMTQCWRKSATSVSLLWLVMSADHLKWSDLLGRRGTTLNHSGPNSTGIGVGNLNLGLQDLELDFWFSEVWDGV